MMAYVSQRKCAEQRIAQRVNRHITVRMGDTAEITVNLDSANIQRQTCRQRVNVISVPDSYAEFFHTRELLIICKYSEISL